MDMKLINNGNIFEDRWKKTNTKSPMVGTHWWLVLTVDLWSRSCLSRNHLLRDILDAVSQSSSIATCLPYPSSDSCFLHCTDNTACTNSSLLAKQPAISGWPVGRKKRLGRSSLTVENQQTGLGPDPPGHALWSAAMARRSPTSTNWWLDLCDAIFILLPEKVSDLISSRHPQMKRGNLFLLSTWFMSAMPLA